MSVIPGSPLVQPGTLPGTAAQYDLAFQISPIILQGGIVSQVQGGLGLLTNFLPPPAADGTPFARFIVMPGGTVISQTIGTYPFANQATAANATFQQPLGVSLLMIAPVNQAGGYLTKLAAFTALQQTLAQHNAEGGTYIVATPAFMYQYAILLNMSDVTDEEDRQKQVLWQFDFTQPIVSAAQAAVAQNNLYSGLTSGIKLPNPPPNSGLANASPANLPGVIGALSTFGALPPTIGQ